MAKSQSLFVLIQVCDISSLAQIHISRAGVAKCKRHGARVRTTDKRGAELQRMDDYN